MNIEEINNIINDSLGTMIYFSGTNCSVCHDLKPKIKEQFSSNFPKIKQIYLNDDDKELYANFGVFSIPTIIVFFQGKEFFRQGRNISIVKFINDIKRPYEMLQE